MSKPTPRIVKERIRNAALKPDMAVALESLFRDARRFTGRFALPRAVRAPRTTDGQK